jgi:hypothetical protein
MLAGYLTDAKSDIVGAAADAARAASLQNSEFDARTQARLAALKTAEDEGVNCRDGPQVDVDFEPPTPSSPGEPVQPGFGPGAIVHVHVTCTVNSNSFSFFGFGGAPTLEEDAWEQIDTHRSM